MAGELEEKLQVIVTETLEKAGRKFAKAFTDWFSEERCKDIIDQHAESLRKGSSELGNKEDPEEGEKMNQPVVTRRGRGRGKPVERFGKDRASSSVNENTTPGRIVGFQSSMKLTEGHMFQDYKKDTDTTLPTVNESLEEPSIETMTLPPAPQQPTKSSEMNSKSFLPALPPKPQIKTTTVGGQLSRNPHTSTASLPKPNYPRKPCPPARSAAGARRRSPRPIERIPRDRRAVPLSIDFTRNQMVGFEEGWEDDGDMEERTKQYLKTNQKPLYFKPPPTS